MYKNLYLESKQKYNFLKNNSTKKIMMGGSNTKLTKPTSNDLFFCVYGYSYCPYYIKASELVKDKNSKVLAVNEDQLNQLYDEFLNEYPVSTKTTFFKYFEGTEKYCYNEVNIERRSSPLVIVYQNMKPIVFGGCDTLKIYLNLYSPHLR